MFRPKKARTTTFVAAMRRSLILSCKALLALLLAGAQVPAQAKALEGWSAAPKLNELPTPYGILAVSESEYIYEAQLLLDGDAIEPEISGLLNIRYAFELPGRQAALVSVSRGNETCPIFYQWVVLKADSYVVSPAFGSCSEDIRVSANIKTLTLETPSLDTAGAVDVYVYDGKNVKRK